MFFDYSVRMLPSFLVIRNDPIATRAGIKVKKSSNVLNLLFRRNNKNTLNVEIKINLVLVLI